MNNIKAKVSKRKTLKEQDKAFVKQQPNSDLIEVLKEVEAMENGTLKKKSYNNVEQMVQDILKEN